jgi:hypothetical protein
MPRQFPIFQFPNPPLIAAMLAGAIGRTARGPLSRNATLLSRLALLLWSAEEIANGVNWFRRLLGIMAGVYALAKLSSPPSGYRPVPTTA